MPPKNPHGDFVVSDPDVLRAVAEPEAYALLTRLQRHGPATVAELAPEVGATEAVVREHLDVLAGHGVVRPVGGGVDAGQEAAGRDAAGADGRWEAVSKGLLVDLPDDAESQAVARLLTTRMFLEAAALPASWWAEGEPRLPPEWRRVAGLINAGLWMTTEELRALNDTIEELTAPYANRAEADRPAGARRVRVQCYLMPEPD
jgi:DNA-binding transcriptional ArsR family regulator